MLNRFLYILIFVIFCYGNSCVNAQDWQRITGISGATVTGLVELKDKSILVSTFDGIWHSTDRFSTWTKVSAWSRDTLVYSIAEAGSGAIFAGTSAGLFRCASVGKKWQPVSTPTLSLPIRYLKSYPSGLMFAGTRKKLLRSVNNGASWSVFADSLMKLFNGKQVGMATVGKNNRIHIGQWYSDNDGMYWKTSTTTKAKDYPIFTSMYANEDRVLLSLINITTGEPPALRYSNDNGVKFSPDLDYYKITLNDSGWPQVYQTQMEQEGRVLDHLFQNPAFVFRDTVFYAMQGIGVLRCKMSVNNNQPTLVKLNKRDNFEVIPALYPTCTLILSDSTVLMGTRGGGIYSSVKRGYNFSHLPFTAESPTILKFYQPTKNKDVQFVGTTDGLYRTIDNRKTWKRVDTNHLYKTGSSFHLSEKGTMFILSDSKWYYKQSTLNEWNVCDSCTSLKDIYNVDSGIYIINKDNFYRSIDEGSTWQVFVKDLGKPIYKVAPDSSGKNLFGFALNGQVYSSSDNGIGWKVAANEKLAHKNPNGSSQLSTLLRFTVRGNKVYAAADKGVYVFDMKTSKWKDLTPSYFPDNVFTDPMFVNHLYHLYVHIDTNFIVRVGDKNSIFNAPTTPITLFIDSLSHTLISTQTGELFISTQPTVNLEIPDLLSPVNNENNVGTSTQLKWNVDKTEGKFTVQIGMDNTFTPEGLKQFNTNDLTQPISNLLVNNEYFWRVRQEVGNLKSSWSNVHKFTTISIVPTKISLTQPKNNTNVVSEEISLQWGTDIYSQTYEVEVSEDITFSSIFYRDTNITDNKVVVKSIEKDKNYFWHVRGKNKAGTGTWSDTWGFSTKEGANSVYDTSDDSFYTSINGKVLIIHNNPYYEKEIVLSINDLSGKRVMSLPIEKGTKIKEINISSLSNGFYILRLESNTERIHRNIIIL